MLCPTGGVKLHAELTYLLGVAATAAADMAESCYALAWPVLHGPLLRCVIAAFALLGLCGGLAAAADVVRLLLLPAEMVHAAAAGLYRLHLRSMGAMWRLMRGTGAADAAAAAEAAARLRLRRSRRQRRGGGGGGGGGGGNDAEAAAAPGGGAVGAVLWGAAPEAEREVTAEHVIVGVLLFTPLLALLPTTCAWYLLASTLHWPLAAGRAALLAGAALAARNPARALARRALRPGAYPGEGGGGGGMTGAAPQMMQARVGPRVRFGCN
jgi:hypothetical protein